MEDQMDEHSSAAAVEVPRVEKVKRRRSKRRRAKGEGCVFQRSATNWVCQLPNGFVVNPATGKRRPKYRVYPGGRTRDDALTQLATLVALNRKGQLLDTSTLIVTELVSGWLADRVGLKPKAVNTNAMYRSVIESAIVPTFGHYRVQALTSKIIRCGYIEWIKQGYSIATVAQRHSVLKSALKRAVKDEVILVNPALDAATDLPKVEGRDVAVKENTLDAADARAVLRAAKEIGGWVAAFIALALDAGARIGELRGLKWTDINFDLNTVMLQRQLLRAPASPSKRHPKVVPRPAPLFGILKGKSARTIEITPDTARLLVAHRQRQAEIRMRHRLTYGDLNLVFAREPEHALGVHRVGTPMSADHLSTQALDRCLKAAGAKRITMHGLRHTCASLLLAAGESLPSVAARLGHRNKTLTLTIYAHCLPSEQASTARRMEASLSGA
jgi:integrase